MSDSGTPTENWVLITGASTGIGRACTEYLASHGFHVYAGARKEQDLVELDQIPNVVSVRLDVTSNEDVLGAADLIRERGTGLFGVINNAGIALGGPMVDISDADLLRILDVNVIGMNRVTNAVFPLLLASRGYIILMSSVNGKIATPFLGPYSISKFAVEAYGDTLRRELALHDIKVTIIEPGPFATPIWDKGLELVEEVKVQLSQSPLLANIALASMPGNFHSYRTGSQDPAKLARFVYDILHNPKPKDRYMVIPNARTLKFASLFGSRIIDKITIKGLRQEAAKLKNENNEEN